MQQTPTPVPGRFAGQVVLVTGGGSGIGRAVADRVAAEGASVVVADRDASAARNVAKLLPGARAALFDQTDESATLDEIAALPPLAVVCVNAGVALADQSLEQTASEEWDHLHAVNLRGAYVVVRAALPRLREHGGGSIVFTASTSGLHGHPGAAAYAAAKAGVVNLSRSLALELAHEGIRVNAVCPGGVRTPLLRRVAPASVVDGETETPLGPLADPEDVAAAVSFLASADARHVTGIELVVDGGLSAGIRRG